jgi:chromate transporter
VDRAASNIRPSMLRDLRLLGTFVVLWAVPVGVLYLWRGGENVLVREALFFTGAAFLTFGGAYSVLSYVADVAVNGYGWLTADQMVQGLGLAESTPGPLIMVTQYVGFIGAWNDPGPFAPLLYGTLGALITTYATFLPCFLFIFLLAPYIELLANDRRLKAILIGVTAAVVGVVANLAVYFATHVLFPDGVSVAGSTYSRWWSLPYRSLCCNATRSRST